MVISFIGGKTSSAPLTSPPSVVLVHLPPIESYREGQLYEDAVHQKYVLHWILKTEAVYSKKLMND